MTKKKIIIIASGAVFLIFILVLLLINNRNSNIKSGSSRDNVFVPEFLSVDEKQSLGIPEHEQIQVISRDENNEVLVYKIIEEGAQAVNPQNIAPLSPRINNQE